MLGGLRSMFRFWLLVASDAKTMRGIEWTVPKGAPSLKASLQRSTVPRPNCSEIAFSKSFVGVYSSALSAQSGLRSKLCPSMELAPMPEREIPLREMIQTLREELQA